MIEMLVAMLQAGNPLLAVAAGLMIGLFHSLEPDHLSSVSAQMVKDYKTGRSKMGLAAASSLRGLLWGAGHTSVIVLVGLLVAGLSLSISDGVFLGAEALAGVMLVILGAFALANRGIMGRGHVHPHTHPDGTSHTHAHSHGMDHVHGHKSYLIGCVHGMAGSGGLVALVASGMGGLDMMIYFLVLFGVGSMIGMALAGGILGLPIILLSGMARVGKYMRYMISGIALVMGIGIIFSVVL